MKFLGLIAVLVGGQVFAAPKTNIHCQIAAGYYGEVRMVEGKEKFLVIVKNGLALNPNDFLRHLGVPQPGFVSRVQLELPAKDCQSAGELEVSCDTRTVLARFQVDFTGPVKTVVLHEAQVSLAPTESGKQNRFILSAMRRNDKGVPLFAEMLEVFSKEEDSSLSSCRAF